jgi:hypothetical protein
MNINYTANVKGMLFKSSFIPKLSFFHASFSYTKLKISILFFAICLEARYTSVYTIISKITGQTIELMKTNQ